MSYYHKCPLCGAHLDPGEQCDCQEAENPEIDERCITAGKACTPVIDQYAYGRPHYDCCV